MQRAFICAVIGIVTFGVLTASTVLACVEDSQDLQLINGELPGGG